MKVLSQTRIEILKALKDRNKTLSELSKELGLSKATLSRHLAILQAEGIVKRVENGNRFVYYKLSQKGREVFEALISAAIAFAGSVIAYLSASRLSGAGLQDASGVSPPSPTSSPASAPMSPVPTPTPIPKPAGGFIPELPGLPGLPEIKHGIDLVSHPVSSAPTTSTSPTSPAAAAVLAFLFLFVIVLLSIKLVAVRGEKRNV